MSVINRRNAVMGWAVWNVMKRVSKSKARKATPTVEGGKPTMNISPISAAGRKKLTSCAPSSASS